MKLVKPTKYFELPPITLDADPLVVGHAKEIFELTGGTDLPPRSEVLQPDGQVLKAWWPDDVQEILLKQPAVLKIIGVDLASEVDPVNKSQG